MTGCLFDTERLVALSDGLRAAFRDARPFPHVVVDGLLRLSVDALSTFPGPEWDGWEGYADSYQPQKTVCEEIASIPDPFASLIQELSQPPVLRALERITGIPRLLPDPYLKGGGLHLSGPGGTLALHTDFHRYEAMDLYRRVNLLVYLNDGWSVEDGGCLELHDEQRACPPVVIVPEWGRCVIFGTDDRSVHGFPQPIQPGRCRRSIALYYYTARDSERYAGDSTTYWRTHEAQVSSVGRARLATARGLLHASRALSLLAHLSNPHQGRRWWNARQRQVRRRSGRDNRGGVT